MRAVLVCCIVALWGCVMAVDPVPIPRTAFDAFPALNFTAFGKYGYGWMHGCMDAWMHGCMDAWMHGCMDAWMHGCMDAWMHGCMDAWMHGWTHGWMHGWMDA